MQVGGLVKRRYVATCQCLLLLALMATMVIAVSGIARIDIVGPHTSVPADQVAHTTDGAR